MNALHDHAGLTGAPVQHEARPGYLQNVMAALAYPADDRHRTIMLAHLFDDTMRMLDAMEPFVSFDAIVGVPYSSNRPGVAERWRARFGDRVHIAPTLEGMERHLTAVLDAALTSCAQNGQKLIVQEVGGFVSTLLHQQFRDRLHLVAGVVEITKQGVWRAEALGDDLAIPILHCADSEMKRLEAKRCGETIARCLDGIARDLGQSLAGRFATVVGAGWIGAGIAEALRRLDMIPALIDRDPLKVAEARLNGFAAATDWTGLGGDWLGRSGLLVGATGRQSITADMLQHLPERALVASGSSRQVEIDVGFLKRGGGTVVSPSVQEYRVTGTPLLLVNDGFPANFIPGSGSVPDEIVEIILAELMVLQTALATQAQDHAPGIHRITPEQEQICVRTWLAMRDGEVAQVPADGPPPPAGGSNDTGVSR